MSYTTQSVKGAKLDGVEAVIYGKPGDWCFRRDMQGQIEAIFVMLPDGTDQGQHTLIPLVSGSIVWKWDGDEAAPTVKPSIDCRPRMPEHCGWHGFMTKGALVSV